MLAFVKCSSVCLTPCHPGCSSAVGCLCSALHMPGGQGGGETYRRTLHKSKPASISGNNHGLVCTKQTVSMSVCIHIKGFDGKWWQGKTMFCIQNKRSPCFRWQRLAVLCHPFFHKQRIWMQTPRNQRKKLHTKTQGTGILVAI